MVVPADVFPGKVDRRLADFLKNQRQIGRRGATPSGGLPSPNQCFLENVVGIVLVPRLLLGKQQQLGSVIGEPLVPFLLPGIVNHEVISTSVSYSVARLIFCLTILIFGKIRPPEENAKAASSPICLGGGCELRVHLRTAIGLMHLGTVHFTTVVLVGIFAV